MPRLKSRPRCDAQAAVHVWTEPDVDYVGLFRDLLQQIRPFLRPRGKIPAGTETPVVWAKGKKDATVPTVPALLRVSYLQYRLGCFRHAQKFAWDALKLDEHCAEAHWIFAMSSLAQAEVQLGLLCPGPGHPRPRTIVDAEDDVDAARAALTRYVRLTHRRDEEACALLDALTSIVSARLQAAALRKALAGLVDFSP